MVPQQTLSVSEYIKRSQAKPIPIEEYIRRNTMAYVPVQDYVQSIEDRSLSEEAMNAMSQFAIGFAENVMPKPSMVARMFGINAEETATAPPDNTVGSIARGVGDLAGFLVPMAGANKLLKATKPEILYEQIGQQFGKKAANAAEWGVNQMVPMTAASLYTGGGEPSAAAEGAEMAATFAAVSLINPKSKMLGWVLRQVGGRALQAVEGKYDTNMFSKEQLANTVFNEALNTIFFTHGVTPKEILSGEYKNPKSKKLVDDLTEEVHQENQRIVTESVPIPISDYTKMQRMDISPENLDINQVIVDHEVATRYKKTLERLEKEERDLGPILVDYDPATDKYRPAETENGNNLAVAYLTRALEEKRRLGDPAPITLPILIRTPRPDTKITYDTPVEAVRKYIMADENGIINGDVLNKAQKTQYAILDSRKEKGKRIKLLHWDEPIVTLSPYEILFKVDNDFKLTIESVGDSLKGKVFQGGTRSRSSKERNDIILLNREINSMLERQEANASSAPPEGMRPSTWGGVLDTELAHRLKIRKGVLAQMQNAKNYLPEQEMLAAFKANKGVIETSFGKINIEQLGNEVTGVFKKIRAFPDMPISERYISSIRNVLNKFDMEWEPAQFFKAIGVVDAEGKVPIRMAQPLIESNLRALASLPDAASRHGFITDQILANHGIVRATVKKGTPEWVRQREIEAYEVVARKKMWERLKEESKKNPGGGSALQRALTIGVRKSLMDSRIAFAKIESDTGIPLYTIHRVISEGFSAKWVEQKYYESKLDNFIRMPQADQISVGEYYITRYNNGDYNVIYDKLSDRARKFIGVVDEINQELAPDIVRWRHRTWMLQRENPVERDHDKAFKNQDEPEVKEWLANGSILYSMKDKSLYEAWIKQTVSKGYGLIDAGAYFPIQVMGAKSTELSRIGKLQNADSIGHGHILERGSFRGKDVEEFVLEQVHEKDMTLRYKNYISQILSLKHLSPGLDALNAVMQVYPEMARAKRKGMFRESAESRAYTTEEYLKLYAMRVKGYPVKMDVLSSALKGAQLAFFKTLTVQPKLWLRNLPQMIVNFPSKKFIDPRFMKMHFKNLPENVKGWLHSRGIDDADAFSHAYLELETTHSLAGNPIIKPIWRAADAIGRFYAYTDTINRKFVYTRSWYRGKFYIDKYLNKEIDLDKMENSLDIDKLMPIEQKEFRAAVQKGEADNAAFYIARWQTENSQWKYSRHERSLTEMTGGGEALSNLLVWPKSMIQHVSQTAYRFYDAAQRYQYVGGIDGARGRAAKQMLHASAEVVGLALSGYVANKALETVTVTYGSKYQSYGLDMFSWQFGGVTNEILSEFSAKTAALLDGTEKSRTDWIKMADNLFIRQMIPFSKQTLSLIETVTGKSYISPLYSLAGKLESGYWRGDEKVDRTLLEGITHAIFAADPNKSEQVRRYAWDKLNDLKSRYASSTGATKEYYAYQVKRYEYLTDLFMRYEPSKVQEQYNEKYLERQMDQKIKSYENSIYQQYKQEYKNE